MKRRRMEDMDTVVVSMERTNEKQTVQHVDKSHGVNE